MTERIFIVTIDDCPDNLEPMHIKDAVQDYLVVTCKVEEGAQIANLIEPMETTS